MVSAVIIRRMIAAIAGLLCFGVGYDFGRASK